MATKATGQNLGELEFSWFATRSGIVSNRINDHKRAYFIKKVGLPADPPYVSLRELEQRWLGSLDPEKTGASGIGSDLLGTLPVGLSSNKGATPDAPDRQGRWAAAARQHAGKDSLYQNENKRVFYQNVATEV